MFDKDDLIKIAYYIVMALCNLIKSDKLRLNDVVKKNWSNLNIALNTFSKESKHKVYQEYRFRIYEMILSIFELYKQH